MISLRLLGGVAVLRDGIAVVGRATQRRRLAVLLLLGTAPGGTLSRDRIVGLLWPEASTDAARRLLSDALYVLRAVLGADAILSRGDDVALDVARVSVDTLEFGAALAAGELERAVTTYGGPLAEGFFVAGAPEFERWLEAARNRLQRDYHAALEALAGERAQRGDAAGAVDAWRRLVVADPFDARSVVGLMDALAAVGNRAAALAQARAYAASLHDELGCEPEEAVREAEERIRRALEAEIERGGTPAAGRRTAMVPSETSPPTEERGAGPVPASGAARAARRAAAAVAVTLLGALTWTAVRSGASGEGAGGEYERVAVLPFRVDGSDEYAYLRDGMAHLLATSLDGAGRLRSVNPDALLRQLRANGEALAPEAVHRIGERFEAPLVVVGSIVESNGALRATANIHDSRAGRSKPIATVVADADGAQVIQLVDVLAARIIAATMRDPEERAARVAATATHSLPALKAYLAGEREFRLGRFVPAAEAYLAATREDTAFALAHYRYSLATLWADLPGANADSADARALRHAHRLAERDRMLLAGYVAWRRGRPAEAERVYRSLIANYPDEIEAWHQLGETLFHYNPLRGRSVSEALEPFEQVRRLDPGHWSAHWHLAQLYALEGRQAEVVQTLEQLLRSGSGSTSPLELRALLAVARGDATLPPALLRELRTADELRLTNLAWRSAVHLRDLGSAETFASLMVGPHRSAYSNGIGRATLAYLTLAQGRFATARQQADSTLMVGGLEATAMQVRLLAALHPYAPDRTSELAEFRAALESWQPADEAQSLIHEALGAWAATALADTAALRRHAAGDDALRRRAADADATLAERARADAALARAQIALVENRRDAALALFAEASPQTWYGYAAASPLNARTLERFTRAELLRDAGRHQEALGWYAGFAEHMLHDLALLAPASLHAAEIHERFGRRDDAVREYSKVVELWSGCDPELQPLVDDVKARLERLTQAG